MCLFFRSSGSLSSGSSTDTPGHTGAREDEKTVKAPSDMFLQLPDSKWSKSVYSNSSDIDSDAASTGVVEI